MKILIIPRIMVQKEGVEKATEALSIHQTDLEPSDGDIEYSLCVFLLAKEKTKEAGKVDLGLSGGLKFMVFE